jgi:hypothetical protein
MTQEGQQKGVRYKEVKKETLANKMRQELMKKTNQK